MQANPPNARTRARARTPQPALDVPAAAASADAGRPHPWHRRRPRVFNGGGRQQGALPQRSLPLRGRGRWQGVPGPPQQVAPGNPQKGVRPALIMPMAAAPAGRAERPAGARGVQARVGGRALQGSAAVALRPASGADSPSPPPPRPPPTWAQALALHSVNAEFSFGDLLGALPTSLTKLEVAASVFDADWGEARTDRAPAPGSWSATPAWARLPRLRRLVIDDTPPHTHSLGFDIFDPQKSFRRARARNGFICVCASSRARGVRRATHPPTPPTLRVSRRSGSRRTCRC